MPPNASSGAGSVARRPPAGRGDCVPVATSPIRFTTLLLHRFVVLPLLLFRCNNNLFEHSAAQSFSAFFRCAFAHSSLSSSASLLELLSAFCLGICLCLSLDTTSFLSRRFYSSLRTTHTRSLPRMNSHVLPSPDPAESLSGLPEHVRPVLWNIICIGGDRQHEQCQRP